VSALRDTTQTTGCEWSAHTHSPVNPLHARLGYTHPGHAAWFVASDGQYSPMCGWGDGCMPAHSATTHSLKLSEHSKAPNYSKHPCYSHPASPWPSVYPPGCTFQAVHESNTFRHPATCGRAIRIVLHSPSHHSLRIITTRCGTAASTLIFLACPDIYACNMCPWWCLPVRRCW